MNAMRLGEAVTGNGARYLQQLCKHWSHKFPVESAGTHGTIGLPSGRVTLVADPDRLKVTIEPGAEADPVRLQQVVEEHINRFAFREAPLDFGWKEEEVSQ